MIEVDEDTLPTIRLVDAGENVEIVEEPVMSHLCPYCGTMAYVGQIHGMGYCKEKVQYEQ